MAKITENIHSKIDHRITELVNSIHRGGPVVIVNSMMKELAELYEKQKQQFNSREVGFNAMMHSLTVED